MPAVFPYIESHKFYCEHWFTTRFFQKIRAFGRCWRSAGCCSRPTTSSTCGHVEVEDALADVMLAWASAAPSSGPALAADRRRAQARSWRRCQLVAAARAGRGPRGAQRPGREDALGHHPGDDRGWLGGRTTTSRPSAAIAASPGVVEGVARVLLNVNDIGQIREGEVLVCPVTAPSWGPVFGKIAAAVSDIGGTMSHAAIVAREYGMPAVVGTGIATTRIKTGDRSASTATAASSPSSADRGT